MSFKSGGGENHPTIMAERERERGGGRERREKKALKVGARMRWTKERVQC